MIPISAKIINHGDADKPPESQPEEIAALAETHIIIPVESYGIDFLIPITEMAKFLEPQASA